MREHEAATDLDNLKRGDLVRLRETFRWAGGRFAGKIVEITDAEEGHGTVPGMATYAGQLRARGRVVMWAILFTLADIAMRPAGWCSTGTCAEPVTDENKPCDLHQPPGEPAREPRPPEQLVQLAHQLYAERLHAFEPAHMGGTHWVLASEVDANDRVTVVNDDNVATYTCQAWDPEGDGGEPIMEVPFGYDPDLPGARLQATLQALEELQDLNRRTGQAER
jgi:hypothetical protein